MCDKKGKAYALKILNPPPPFRKIKKNKRRKSTDTFPCDYQTFLKKLKPKTDTDKRLI